MKFCPKCGHQLDHDAKFCPFCGAQLTAPTTATTAAAQPTSSSDSPQSTPVNDSAAADQSASATTTAQPSPESLGFVGSIQYVMQHAFEFTGNPPEPRKSVFWWAFLGVTLLNLAFVGIPYLGTILCWATSILLVSAAMRRLTYLNQGAGLGWLLMVPVVSIYPLILLIMDQRKAD